MNEAVQIIQTIGFPIFAFLLLAWYINKQGERHEEEIKSLRESYEKNTEILVGLKEIIERLDEKWN